MSSPKQSKSAIVSLLTSTSSNPRFVPPVLRDVGKLAAGVAAVSTNSGSATGNPRNKCVLQPGHSLMDWIRLGASGKDLTGVGPQAGHLAVTPSELAKHNKLTDAWLAIRGKVFNVTAYLPFHPGGPEELMKGIGKDATTLFDEIHSWVNYESILQKCVIGRLVPLSPSVDAQELFNSGANEKPLQSQKTFKVELPKSEPPSNSTKSASPHEELSHKPSSEGPSLPIFDWIQKMNEITIIFYTAPLANPLVEVKKTEETIQINLCHSDRTFSNELTLFKETLWPCEVKVNYETGKIEFVFRKVVGEVWSNYGVLRQKSKGTGSLGAENRLNYVVAKKSQVASNIFLLELERMDGVFMVVPISYHVRVFSGNSDEDISRSYTPVPSCLFSHIGPAKRSTEKVCLMVKRYPDGKMSKYVCDAIKGDVLQLSKPLFGGFNLIDLDKIENILFLAAGTGITPMLSIIVFLLERRIRRSQSIRLIFCNRKQEYIPFMDQFQQLSNRESRFRVEHVLSDPDEYWQGNTGHITKEIIGNTIDEQLSNANYPKRDLRVFICGPMVFNEMCVELLTELNIQKEQLHIFIG